MMKIVIGAAFGAFAALAAAVNADTGRRDVSFARDVQPIFSARCTMCHHESDHMGELVLSPSLAYEQLVDAPAVGAPDFSRVIAKRPEASYLMMKLDGTHAKVGGKGWIMPPPTNPFIRLGSSDRETIRLWITQGALNN
ncbi:MAG: hypothetical protein R3E04_12215 [Sphingobium sp.]